MSSRGSEGMGEGAGHRNGGDGTGADKRIRRRIIKRKKRKRGRR